MAAGMANLRTLFMVGFSGSRGCRWFDDSIRWLCDVIGRIGGIGRILIALIVGDRAHNVKLVGQGPPYEMGDCREDVGGTGLIFC